MKQEVKFLPISEYQKRFFLEWAMAPHEILYNVSLVNRIRGDLNRNALKQASEAVIKGNEVFFARYSKDGETCWHCDFSIDDFFHESILDSEKPLELQLRQILGRSFDLTKDVLVQFYLVRDEKADNEFYFIMLGHHIIADAIHAVQISLQIQNAYNQLVEGKTISLNIEKTFTGAVEAERNILTKGYKAEAQKFWLDLIDDLPLNVELPYRSGVDAINFNNLTSDRTGESIFFDLSREQTASLKAYAKEKKTTLFIVFSALYGLILSKYCNQERLLLSYPINMRPKGFREVTGCFVNNVPLKLDLTKINTFDELLDLLGAQRREAKPHQGYSLTDIIQDQRRSRGGEISSFFNVGFTQTSLNTTSLKLNGLDVAPIDTPWNEKIVNEIGLLYDEYSSDVIKFRFEYRKALFDNDLIHRFISSFKKAVDDIVNPGGLHIKGYSPLSGEEYDQVVYRWNDTLRDYPKSKTICQLFQEQVDRTPDDTAAICNGLELTYRELNEKSNQLSRYIRKYFKDKNGAELTPGTLIPLFMDRGLEMLVGILAVLKSGGAYVPVDTGYPQKRVDYILENTQAELILSLSGAVNALDGRQPLGKVLCIDLADELYTKEDKSNPPSYSKPADLAYVIYTSGTTGNPKGVLIEHQSLVNYVAWGSKVYVRAEKVSFPLYTSISFDLTVTSIFIPLVSGSSIVVYPDNDSSLPIEEVIKENRVQVLKATPSHLKILKESHLFRQEGYASRIKRFIVGGESFTTSLAGEISDLFGGDVEIYNEYGPTEATVGCMIYKYDREKDKSETVPIGIPIDNSQIYLLNDSLSPVPIGAVGHMYISGDCLARGYLFRPDLTEEKFLDSPFCAGQKMYKTGDLARKLPAGDIEFIGRKDQQVKVNGYRIELEEIEYCIQKYDGIRNTVVLMVDGNGIAKLCAYYVLNEGSDDGGLREHMQRQLPRYMIPSLLCRVDRIPLTPNGKVDRDALLRMEGIINRDEIRPAENEVQELLAKVFQDVLMVSGIGIDDNFFELGGDSIKAVQITSRLYDRGLSLNVKDILTHQTISRISPLVERSQREYEQGAITGEKMLSPIEQWFFEQKFENPNHYNQSVLLEFRRSVDKENLERAFEKLIEHHDGLRLNYRPERKCMFFNEAHLGKAFTVDELDVDDRNTLEAIGAKVKSSFDITSSLLVKAAILRRRGFSDRVLLSAHHLVIDGVSWRILLEDLGNLYLAAERGESYRLPKKNGNLIDWQNTLNEYSESDGLRSQIEYWNSIERAELELIDVENRITKPDWGTEKRTVILDREKTEFLLKDANKPYNTDIQILLITSLLLTLKELVNRNPVVIEMENYGRMVGDIDTSRTIGWFTAIYPLGFNVEKEELGANIMHVKERVRKVPDNGIGYGVLRYLNKRPSQAKRQKAEIRFNYLGQFGGEVSNDLFSLSTDFSGDEISRANRLTANLEVNSFIAGEILNIEMVFSKNKFTEPEISAVKENLLKNLDGIISYLKKEEGIHFTPSDFDTVELDEEDFKVLFE